MNQTNQVWKQLLKYLRDESKHISSPRGMKVKEVIGGGYIVPMPAYISLASRKVNYNFMFAEAYWILSGSNRLSEVSKYMKRYGDFSDDGVFLNGAYGPKVVDQLKYVVDCLDNDNDSRQAVINIWRERPAPSKDIPCTLSMQFLIRDDELFMVVSMRSHDVVLGFTYDVFTFSMVALAIKLLLEERGVFVELGNLNVNAGSLHLYEDQEPNLNKYLSNNIINGNIKQEIDEYLNPRSYEELLKQLKMLASKTSG